MSDDYKLFRDDYDIKRNIEKTKYDLIKSKPSISDLQSFENGEIKFYEYADNNQFIQEAVIRIEDKLYKLNLTLLED